MSSSLFQLCPTGCLSVTIFTCPKLLKIFPSQNTTFPLFPISINGTTILPSCASQKLWYFETLAILNHESFFPFSFVSSGTPWNLQYEDLHFFQLWNIFLYCYSSFPSSLFSALLPFRTLIIWMLKLWI